LVAVAEADDAPLGRRSREIWLSSGSLDLPTLLIDRHAYDLGHGRWRLGVLGRAEAEVIEDLLDGYVVVEVGNDLELPPALAARERVGMEDLRDQARPTRGTAALLGWLLFNLGLSRLLRGAISAHSIAIVAVKERAMPCVRGSPCASLLDLTRKKPAWSL